MTAQRLSQSTLVAFWLLASCCSDPKTPDLDLGASNIVKREALDAFDTFLPSAEDRQALLAYSTGIQGAKSRDDLSQAWTSNAYLSGRKAGLPERIFKRSEQDGDWPQSPPVEESSYVTGFRAAVDKHSGGSR